MDAAQRRRTGNFRNRLETEKRHHCKKRDSWETLGDSIGDFWVLLETLAGDCWTLMGDYRRLAKLVNWRLLETTGGGDTPLLLFAVSRSKF
jgi:hypothetical protein